MRLKIEKRVKNHKWGGTVKRTRCKARESLGISCAYKFVGMTNDEAQRSRWTFYEAVKVDFDVIQAKYDELSGCVSRMLSEPSRISATRYSDFGDYI